MTNVIEVKSLIKHFGPIRAVDGISFNVQSGDLFAFLGPNGAGKTTTIHILCTLLGFDAGEVTVCGFKAGQNDSEIRCRIGVVFQENSLDHLLTVRQNLIARAYLYDNNKSRISSNLDRLCEVLNIGNLLQRPYGKLSGGQKRRCEIAQALMHSPSVLFLDEPTTGLDPQTRAHVWESIRLLRQEQGTTVFLTTHYLEEAVHSSQIAIIDEGKIAAQGTPYELKERFSTDILKVASDDPAEVRNLLTAMALPYQEKEDVLHVKVPHSLKALEILKKIENHLLSFEVVHGTLEDVFLNITGKTLRED